MTTKAEQLVVCEKAGECDLGYVCEDAKRHKPNSLTFDCTEKCLEHPGAKCIPVGQEERTDECEHKYIVMGLDISHRKIYECTKCGKREDG